MSAVTKVEKSNVTELQAATPTPMHMMQAMVERGTSPEQLEKMMDLHDRWEASEARKAFAEALASFQAEVPIIFKNKRGDKATYAPLEQVIATTRPHLGKHGLSVRFDTELGTSTDGSPCIITATCYITHRMGHMEQNHFSAPVDLGPTNSSGKRVMNGAQAVASARSYAKRYALGDALNLAFTDEDDDGAGTHASYITEKQVVIIREWIESTDSDEKAFCDWLKVDDVESIFAKDFNKALNALKQKGKK